MPGFRFQSENRLPDQKSFQPVFDRPDLKVGHGHFLFLARYNDRPVGRLGLVVAKKRARRSVDRSLIKRLAREAFRVHPEIVSGLDVVILLRRPADRPDRAKLAAELAQGLDKLLAKRAQA